MAAVEKLLRHVYAARRAAAGWADAQRDSWERDHRRQGLPCGPALPEAGLSLLHTGGSERPSSRKRHRRGPLSTTETVGEGGAAVTSALQSEPGLQPGCRAAEKRQVRIKRKPEHPPLTGQVAPGGCCTRRPRTSSQARRRTVGLRAASAYLPWCTDQQRALRRRQHEWAAMGYKVETEGATTPLLGRTANGTPVTSSRTRGLPLRATSPPSWASPKLGGGQEERCSRREQNVCGREWATEGRPETAISLRGTLSDNPKTESHVSPEASLRQKHHCKKLRRSERKHRGAEAHVTQQHPGAAGLSFSAPPRHLSCSRQSCESKFI